MAGTLYPDTYANKQYGPADSTGNPAPIGEVGTLAIRLNERAGQLDDAIRELEHRLGAALMQAVEKNSATAAAPFQSCTSLGRELEGTVERLEHLANKLVGLRERVCL